MVWEQIEATPPHLTYMILAGFLISYTLFSTFIKNRLHLSEPPIALLVGILVGPQCLGWLTPSIMGVNGGPLDQAGNPAIGGWGWGDGVVQETARIIVGMQVFVVGVELPKFYASRHWKSIAMLVGPVMTLGWLICAAFIKILFGVSVATALTVAACLTPTDPVLSASILSNSQFSGRVPKRIKDMLSAESGCNDGTSFPFLYIGLTLLNQSTVGEAAKQWFLITILWQCVFGTFIGMVLGTAFNRILRFSEHKNYIDTAGFMVFYFFLAILSIGVASTLGVDDFLVAFGAGYGFARDGWFQKTTKSVHLANIIDLLWNSAMFVYVGAIIPWYAFEPRAITPNITVGTLIAFLALVLLFRRIPIILATYQWIPDIRTLREALFCGHFGPMGLGGIFLAIEARAVLETGSAKPEPHPPQFGRPFTDKEIAIETVWPLVTFIVLGSTMVHGLSVLMLSILSHFRKPKSERASILAAETAPLDHMVHGEGDGSSEPSDDEDNLGP